MAAQGSHSIKLGDYTVTAFSDGIFPDDDRRDRECR